MHDKIDILILKTLQSEGRIAMTELAERVNLSTTPCVQRVRRLEREGFITGYFAKVNPATVNRRLLVFIEIKLSNKSEAVFHQAKTALLLVPEVLECHLVTGEFDYLVKARLAGMAQYRQMLGRILKDLSSVAEAKSRIVMEEIKETLVLPL
jgi:Lrp/AsnC family transcriptional regulator, leucine-responsive regulatory protein